MWTQIPSWSQESGRTLPVPFQTFLVVSCNGISFNDCWLFIIIKVVILKTFMNINSIFDTIYGRHFSAAAIQCIYIQSWPHYIIVFIGSGRVRHSRTGCWLPPKAWGIHNKQCMHVIQWNFISLLIWSRLLFIFFTPCQSYCIISYH